jgi:limonene-1,2-epoxide hydrolase
MTHRRELLSSSAGGLLGALMLSSANAQEGPAKSPLSELEKANISLVNRFCAAWEAMDLVQVTSTMTANAIYRQSQDTPPVTGHQALIDLMQPWIESSNAITYEVLETFARGPVVVNHRIDIYHSDTNHLEWEGVGLFLIEDGLIREWQDFTMRIQRGKA